MNPGWYPDPDDEDARRYWDGEAWSAPLRREQRPEAPPLAASLPFNPDEYEPEVVPGSPRRMRGRPCSSQPCNRSAEGGLIRCTQHMTEADMAYISDLTAKMKSSDQEVVTKALATYNALPGPEFEAVALLKRQQADSVVAPTSFANHAVGDAAIVCPNCQTRGHVTTRRIKQKKGISGGKATGAILTGGLSMLGTGLSRKETVTEFRCGKCITTWHG